MESAFVLKLALREVLDTWKWDRTEWGSRRLASSKRVTLHAELSRIVHTSGPCQGTSERIPATRKEVTVCVWQ